MNEAPPRRSWVALVPVAAMLLVVAIVIADPARLSTEVAQPTTTPLISAGSAATLSARYAVVTGSMTFTRESDGVRVGSLSASPGSFAVSPDGTRIAYIPGPGFDELWIADVGNLDRPRRVLSIAPRLAGGLVWSTDGKGILFSTQSTERAPGPGGGPLDSTLDAVHLDTNRREAFLGPGNVSIRPLVWVREPRFVAAVRPFGQKGPGEYVAISAAGAKFWALPDAARAGVSVDWPIASSDGRWVAAQYRYGARGMIRVWPSEDLARATELESPGTEIKSALWRPGSLDIGVDVSGALELWQRDGVKRRVADLGGGSLIAFRWDGSAAYVGKTEGPLELIEIDTGRRVQLPASISIRFPLVGSLRSARLE